MMTGDRAFIDGYMLVKNGLITRELSENEVASFYREYLAESSVFRNGIADALGTDSFRYNLILDKAQQRLAGINYPYPCRAGLYDGPQD